jgi:hypothetical protein
MYCPRCGQQQASSEIRFCSRCGFPLGGVVELLARGGLLPANDRAVAQEEQALSPRATGLRQGALMMLLGTVVVPILAILNSFQDETTLLHLLVPICAVIFFAGGLMRIIYAALFEKGAAGAQQTVPEYASPVATAQLNAGMRASALPPPQSIPVEDYAPRRMNTAELVSPPSVTENTTKLLGEEKSARQD